MFSIKYSNLLNKTTFPSATNTNDSIIAKGDSGAIIYYWRDRDKHIFNDVKTEPGPRVTLPTNTTIQTSEKFNIPLSNKLTKTATDATVLPTHESLSLTSLGQLCDDDCKILINSRSLW